MDGDGDLDMAVQGGDVAASEPAPVSEEQADVEMADASPAPPSSSGAHSPAAGPASSEADSSDATPPQFQREEELLGYNPVKFVDDVINCVEDYLCDGLDALEKALAREPALSSRHKEVADAVDGVYVDLEKSLALNFDKFELYVLRNILKLSDSVVLPETEEDVAQHKGVNKADLRAEVGTLQRRLHAAKYMNKALRREVRQVDAELASFRTLDGALDIVKHLDPSKIKMIASHAQALKARDEELRAAVQASGLNVPAAAAAPGSVSSAAAPSLSAIQSTFAKDFAQASASSVSDVSDFAATLQQQQQQSPPAQPQSQAQAQPQSQ